MTTDPAILVGAERGGRRAWGRTGPRARPAELAWMEEAP